MKDGSIVPGKYNNNAAVINRSKYREIRLQMFKQLLLHLTVTSKHTSVVPTLQCTLLHNVHYFYETLVSIRDALQCHVAEYYNGYSYCQTWSRINRGYFVTILTDKSARSVLFLTI